MTSIMHVQRQLRLLALLRAIVDTLTATWRGDSVPADIYDAALAARSAFRAN